MAEEILLIMSLEYAQQLVDILTVKQKAVDKSIARVACILDAIELKFNLPGVQCPVAGVLNPDAENVDSVTLPIAVNCSTEPVVDCNASINKANLNVTDKFISDIESCSIDEPATLVSCSKAEPATLESCSIDEPAISEVANIFGRSPIIEPESDIIVNDSFDKASNFESETELINCSIANFTVKGSIDEPTVAFDDPANVNISNDTFMLESLSNNDRQTPNPTQMTFNESLNSSLSCKGGGRFRDS